MTKFSTFGPAPAVYSTLVTGEWSRIRSPLQQHPRNTPAIHTTSRPGQAWHIMKWRLDQSADFYSTLLPLEHCQP